MAVNKNFIVKNGIEVKNNLIYADTDLNSVGIGTTIVQHKFHVIGGIGATTTVISGISTVGSLSVGSNEVISSARQLKNIASLDTTTQNTIEAATKGSPNEYDDLVVTGVSTFKADVIAEDNLLVSGIATFTGTPNLPGANVSGVSTFAALVDANGGIDANSVNVSGVSTFAGIGTFSSHLYVGGNLNVVGDVVYDEVTGRNINITGLGTIAQFNSTNAVLGVATATTFSGDLTGTVNTAAQPNITSLGTIAQLGATNANVTGVGTVAQFNATNAVLGVATATSFVGDLTGTVQTAAQPNITSLGTIANLSATNANITGVGTVAQFNATNAVVGVATFTTATIGTLVGGLSGVSTEFTGQIGIQSGGVRIGTGVTQLNFVGSGNTFQYNPSTDTVDITISGGGGGGGGSVSIGQTAPVNPSSGDLWFNIDIARTFVYYNEAALGVGSSSFWVDASPFEASGMFLSKMGDNMLAGLGITAGTISAPGLYFNGDTNTGLYSPAADQFAFTAGGVGIATFQAGILEAGGARFSAGGVSAGVVTATTLNVTSAENVLATFESTDADSLIEFKDNGTSDTILVGALGGDDLLLRSDAGSIKFNVANNNEKLRVGPAGQIGLAGANYGSSGQVITSQGGSAAPQWGSAGIGEIDQWYLTADKQIAGSSTIALMTSDLTRAGTANGNFAVKGTGMSYASGTGIWTFPSTGYWQLGYTLIGDGVAEGNYLHYGWQLTTNNSTYTETIQNGTEHLGGGSYYWQVSGTNMFRITDVSNQKVKFFFRHSGGGNLDLMGGDQTSSPANNNVASGWTFVRLSGV